MISFSYRTVHFEILKLKQVFQSNRYPKNLFDCCIKMYLDKVFIEHPNICIMPEKELVSVLTFLRKSHHLQNSIERTLSYCKLKVIFKSSSEISNHFHFKDVLHEKFCSGFVYSFKCNSCNAIYYRKTKRHFYVKATENIGISHLTNKHPKNVSQSAFLDHLLTCDCNINFNEFTTFSKDSNNFNFLIKESLLIARDKPILNKTVKPFPLELFE